MGAPQEQEEAREQLPPQPLPPLGDLPPPPMPGRCAPPGTPTASCPTLPIQNLPAPQPVIEPVESDVARQSKMMMR